MKYKILLVGKNKTIIDDFFALADDVELMTSSARWEDLLIHIRYMGPHAVCFCTANESKETIDNMSLLGARLRDMFVPLIVAGSSENCDEYVQSGKASLVLRDPVSARAIETSIIKKIEELLAEKQEKEEEEQRAAEEKRATEEKNRKRHILVVDDDPHMLRTIKEILHGKYDVGTAVNGRVALKFLEKKTTDLILLDYEMPEENGPAVLAKLRENEATANIPVVFLTGVTEKAKIAQALTMKPQGYVLKPVEYDKLNATIEKLLWPGEV